MAAESVPFQLRFNEATQKVDWTIGDIQMSMTFQEYVRVVNLINEFDDHLREAFTLMLQQRIEARLLSLVGQPITPELRQQAQDTLIEMFPQLFENHSESEDNEHR